MSRWAVVLAGGVGSRFWPISKPSRPKQLLPLATEEPLLSDTLARLAPLVPAERTLILTNASLVEPIAALAAHVPRENIIAEPRPAGTAAALAWAAHEVARRGGRDAVMLSEHAEWSVGDAQGFRDALSHAADVAEAQGALVTVGIVPVRADPGFGYIQPGEDAGGGARHVARFIEKPDRTRAEAMMRDGFLWNSGIFVWRAGDFLDELAALTPEVAPYLAAHADDMEGFFAAIPEAISVDIGVLERSKKVLVLPGDFAWDDVGTWAALRRVRTCDEQGNAVRGLVHALEASGNVVHTDGGAIVLYGVSDLVVVSCEGMTLVTTVEKAADLKTLIESLPPTLRLLP
jgi:mannose-1-phosphate guanylyltransferase